LSGGRVKKDLEGSRSPGARFDVSLSQEGITRRVELWDLYAVTSACRQGGESDSPVWMELDAEEVVFSIGSFASCVSWVSGREHFADHRPKLQAGDFVGRE
jgi:hypothetical protein